VRTPGERYDVPDEPGKHVTAICGERGVAWFSIFPGIVAELEEKWEVVTKLAFEKGEYNFVAPASSESLDAVLKVSPPFPTIEIFAETEFLRILDGSGAPRLLQENRENRAILIERIRPGLTGDGVTLVVNNFKDIVLAGKFKGPFETSQNPTKSLGIVTKAEGLANGIFC